jgi:hypothetical protein
MSYVGTVHSCTVDLSCTAALGVQHTCRPKSRLSKYDFPISPSLPSFDDAPSQWGHALESIDPSKTLRILLQNPNGVKPYHPILISNTAYRDDMK